jgi:uncharacterized membrane protein
MIDLPKHPVFRGHPLHAMLSDLPIGLLPAAAAATIAERMRPRRKRDARMSDLLATMTFAAGAGAAAAGVWDWLTIPRSHPAWLPATLHGAVNLTGVAALGAAVARRDLRLALFGTVAGGTLVGAWLGGALVFEHGWRVKPAEEYEMVAERVSGEDGAVIDDARRQIESFEREKTFLAP